MLIPIKYSTALLQTASPAVPNSPQTIGEANTIIKTATAMATNSVESTAWPAACLTLTGSPFPLYWATTTVPPEATEVNNAIAR